MNFRPVSGNNFPPFIGALATATASFGEITLGRGFSNA